jgi:hypothetical protein
MKGKAHLPRLARGAHEIAQHGYVGTVSSDAARIDGQSKPLGEIQINPGVVKLRQTKSLRGQHAVQSGWVHRPRRAVTLPRAARHFIKLLPIAFVPRGHRRLCYVLFCRLDARCGQKVRFVRHRLYHLRTLSHSSLTGRRAARRSTYFTFDAPRHFPCLLFQTRYRAICFARNFRRCKTLLCSGTPCARSFIMNTAI